MKKLAEFANPTQKERARPLHQFIGEEMTIHDVRFYESQYGEVAFFDAVLQEGEKYTIITSSKHVMEALRRAKEEGALPVTATFTKEGGRWLIQ